jgi:hypothetical protein
MLKAHKSKADIRKAKSRNLEHELPWDFTISLPGQGSFVASG